MPPSVEEIFEKSYDEVLLFLKHQDDKINRVLTALAFLTTAGVTLYIFGRSRPSPPTFPEFAHTHLRGDDYFFGAFLIGLFFALSIALVALDPTSAVPRYLPSKGSDSILYYNAIGKRSSAEWDAVLTDDPQAAFRTSLHKDARRLSHRARHKVRRFGQAGAFVQFAVVALVLLGVMRLNAVPERHRWHIAAGVLIAYTALPLIDFIYQRLLNFPDVGFEYLEGRALATWLTALVFFLPFVLVSASALGVASDQWPAVTFALVGTLALRLIAHEVPRTWHGLAIGSAVFITLFELSWLLLCR